MNFRYTINLGKRDWDEPEEIHVEEFSADSWEEAEAKAVNLLALSDEDFKACLNDEYDVSWCVYHEYTEMRNVVWHLNEVNEGIKLRKRGTPPELTGELTLIGDTKYIDATAKYYEQTKALSDASKKRRALAELAAAQAKVDALK